MKKITSYLQIRDKIHLIRGVQIILDKDLADLYEVETKNLNKAVKRNIERFPEDFMFQLSQEEYENLKSQIVTSSWGGARRARPYAFTEQGVAMLSSVLRSERAIQVNIAIMRAFVRLRQIFSTHKELAYKLAELERKIEKHDEEIKAIFEAIRRLMMSPQKPKRKIGFKVKNKEGGNEE